MALLDGVGRYQKVMRIGLTDRQGSIDLVVGRESVSNHSPQIVKALPTDQQNWDEEQMSKMGMLQHELLMLSGESSVDFYLLAEDEELIKLFANKATYQEMLDYINENY